MTLFELVKIALDELYEEGLAHYGSSLDDLIRNQMTYLSKSYNGLNSLSRLPVDYKDPATRFAYVYKYVAAHGDYLVQILSNLRDVLGGQIFSSENARVTCVGGGPGSDIIGLLKYLDEHHNIEPVKKITCYLLDREQAWADTWTEFDESLSLDIHLNNVFQPLDVTDAESWKSQRKFLQADLFSMSYFVSEVFSLDCGGCVTKFWTELFNNAKSGALFFYNDNGHSDFNTYFDERWQWAGLELLIGCENTRMVPRYSEQASDLGEYRVKFGQSPKLRGYVTYRVLRKS